MGKTVTGSESIWMRGGQLKRIFAVSFMCSVLLDWNAVRGSLKGLRMNMHRWSPSPRPRPLFTDLCHERPSPAAPGDPVRMTIFHENYSLGILSK